MPQPMMGAPMMMPQMMQPPEQMLSAPMMGMPEMDLSSMKYASPISSEDLARQEKQAVLDAVEEEEKNNDIFEHNSNQIHGLLDVEDQLDHSLELSSDMIDASDEEEVGKNEEDEEDAVMNLLDEEGQVGAEMLEGESDSIRDLRLRAAELDREQELEEGLDEDYEIPVGSSGFGPDFYAAGRPLDPNWKPKGHFASENEGWSDDDYRAAHGFRSRKHKEDRVGERPRYGVSKDWTKEDVRRAHGWRTEEQVGKEDNVRKKPEKDWTEDELRSIRGYQPKEDLRPNLLLPSMGHQQLEESVSGLNSMLDADGMRKWHVDDNWVRDELKDKYEIPVPKPFRLPKYLQEKTNADLLRLKKEYLRKNPDTSRRRE